MISQYILVNDGRAAFVAGVTHRAGTVRHVEDTADRSRAQVMDKAEAEETAAALNAQGYDVRVEMKNDTTTATLCDYKTGEAIRPATAQELAASITVDGRSCYAQE